MKQIMNVLAAALLVSGGVIADDATLPKTATGSTNGDLFGRNGGMAGDFNGDGFDDVLVGAPSGGEGYARVIFGGLCADASSYLQIDYVDDGDPSSQTPDAFGRGVSAAGDFNGDGFDDILIGAPGSDYTPQEHDGGGAWLLLGPQGPGTTSVQAPTFHTTNVGDYYGQALAALGDVNDDGYDDIAIGIPGFDDFGDPTKAYTGRVQIHFGGPGWDTTPDLNLDGVKAGHTFGYFVEGGGDVNGDGHNDIVVGATGSAPNAGTFKGKVYVFYGGPSLDAQPDLIFDGPANNSNFGSLSQLFDFTGDGYADILVGASGLNANRGAAYLYTGRPHSASSFPASKSFQGENAGDLFGYYLWAAGDIDTDGRPDVIIGAEGHDGPQGNGSGRAYVFYTGGGFDTVADIVIDGDSVGEALGAEAVCAGDFDGDGVPNFATGSIPGNSPGLFKIFQLDADPTVSGESGFPQPTPSGKLNWVFEWDSDQAANVFDEVNLSKAPKAPAACNVGNVTLTPETYAVTTSVTSNGDGTFRHQLVWNNRTCVAGCSYDWSATTGSCEGSDTGSTQRLTIPPFCPSN